MDWLKNWQFFPKGLPRSPIYYLTQNLAGRIFAGVVVGLVVICLLFSVVMAFVFEGKIYPGVSAGTIVVGNLTPQQATTTLLASSQSDTSKSTFILNANDRTWTITGDQIDLQLDATQTAKQAYKIARDTNPLVNFKTQLALLVRGQQLPPAVTYNKQKLNTQLADVIQSLTIAPQPAKITYVDGQFVVGPSIEGKKVDTVKFMQEVEANITHLRNKPITVPVVTAQPSLTADMAQQMVPALRQYASQPLVLTYEEKRFPLDIATILSLINYDDVNGGQLSLSNNQLNQFVNTVASKIDQPAKDALFQFANGKAVAFAPSQDGIVVDKALLAGKIEQALLSGQGSRVIVIPVTKTPSTVSMADVNTLGINELLAHGESNYKNSPADRIYNIKLAMSRINGSIIAPGAEFSFNNAVGEISQATGYRQALVILSGQTVLGDGGGVCQVSTTVFRASLNAGLPITQRTAHAYRVSYYENDMGPGFDATIYQPGVDFRFKNDTGHYVLLQATVDEANTKLYIDLYGTSDGRVATLSKSSYLSTTPAPPDIHKDDPTLPKGTSKQVEHSIPGAKVIFSRKVVRNGETLISETFTSNFRPWAAVFLDGTKE